ncbi:MULTISPECIES: hypothetical protein [Pseudonocardia]|uniref:hypothetical protein n=1 Tax=Pseudonocardia TaxID=1847 RepID=UPI000F76A283|nr:MULTISPECIES: hypothetical protein [Pseudonocardia]
MPRRNGSGVVAPLLVVVAGPRDVTGSLVDAAGRSVAEERSLVVVVVRPAAPLTINPVVQALVARRVGDQVASLSRAARLMSTMVGVEVSETVVVREPVRWTRAGRRRALTRRLHALAGNLGAELHPVDRCDDGGPR